MLENLKIMRKSLFDYSYYSHPEIWQHYGLKLQPSTTQHVLVLA
jgi:hypothetical protein